MLPPLVAQAAPLLSTPLGKLLAALVVAALVVFVGRFALGLAWRLLRVAVVVVAVVWLASIVLPAVAG